MLEKLGRRTVLGAIVAALSAGLASLRPTRAAAKEEVLEKLNAIGRPLRDSRADVVDCSAEEIAHEIEHVLRIRGLANCHAKYSEKWDVIGDMYSRLFDATQDREAALQKFAWAMSLAAERIQPGVAAYIAGSPCTQAELGTPRRWQLPAIPAGLEFATFRRLWVADELAMAVGLVRLFCGVDQANAEAQLREHKFPYEKYESQVTATDLVLRLSPGDESRELTLQLYTRVRATVTVSVVAPIELMEVHLRV